MRPCSWSGLLRGNFDLDAKRAHGGNIWKCGRGTETSIADHNATYTSRGVI